jgi:GT2 family glycosyltransferase
VTTDAAEGDHAAAVACVILTTGERPAELAAAIASVRAQRDVGVEVVVVRNLDEPAAAPAVEDGVRVVRPGRNLGIPGGRNLGAEASRGRLLLFLDDDAVLGDDDLLCRAVERFDADPALGAISMRLVDPATGRTERRHVPRLRVGDPARSSRVTTFLGGASIVRRAAFDAAGGLPARFLYAHEETSLAWRMADRGYRIRYDADLVVHHPGAPPSRHAHYHHLSARNRVLLARMHLPAPLAVVYVLLWSALTLVRDPGGWRASLRGFLEGLRDREVERRPIAWRTVWRLTRAGRPPIL